MRSVLVVAHPDDEALWFGGLLAAEPGDWTVVCCSIPQSDPERAWKFFDSCRILGAVPRLVPYAERGRELPPQHLVLLDDILGGFDRIVTHSSAGEYGHSAHVALNRTIVGRWPGQSIAGCYGKAQGPRRLALTPQQLAIKMAALRAYDHCAPADGGKPKWQALIDRYGGEFDLGVESYDG